MKRKYKNYASGLTKTIAQDKVNTLRKGWYTKKVKTTNGYTVYIGGPKRKGIRK